MLRALFDLQLQHMIRPGRVAVGEFTEGEMYLAAANMANKVVICKLPTASTYTSRIVPSRDNLQVLNINQTVTALTVGRFAPENPIDYLFIGTTTELIVYDVLRNREILRKMTTGGVSSIVIGKTGRIRKTMALVGGQSSLQGFDDEGNEPLWTLTGDNVAVLTLFDINRDGQIEIITGCDDNQIRIFRETEQIFSMMETDKVISLAALKDQSIAYGLANGTVGAYVQYDRRWRIKSKSKPLSLLGLDVTGNGEPEILCGWSSGKFEARDRFKGEVLFKYQMDDPVAQVLEVRDPTNQNEKYILVASTEGDVKAFAIENGGSREYTVTFLSDSAKVTTENGELASIQENSPVEIKTIISADTQKGMADSSLDWSAIPKDVTVSIEVEPFLCDPNYFSQTANDQLKDTNPFSGQIFTFLRADVSASPQKGLSDIFDRPCLKFRVTSSDPTYKILGVVIFAEGVFNGESYYHHPPEKSISNVAEFPLIISKNFSAEMLVTVTAGQQNRKFYFCHSEPVVMKRFAMYHNSLEESFTKPNGFVTFKLQERTNRFVLWACENFFTKTDYRSRDDKNGITMHFICLRDGEPLTIQLSADNEVTVLTNCIETAGDVVESLVEEMAIKNLSSKASFPKAFDPLQNIFSQVEEYQKNRQRQAAEIAERGGGIRALLTKAEEAKLLEAWSDVKKYYTELAGQNKSVLHDFQIQVEAQEQYSAGLKAISQTIDKAARLRVGPAKTELLLRCRSAVQARDVKLLIRLMEGT